MSIFKILITGASGFLGSHTAKKFGQSECRITGCDLRKPADDFACYFHNFFISDLSKRNFEIQADDFQLVIHCSGGSSVGISYNEPLNDFENTVCSTANILEFIRINCPKAKIILPSSAAVYGNQSVMPISENVLPEPVSPYGYHKLMAENLCREYSTAFGINAAIIRFFSIYGPGLKKQLFWDAFKKIKAAEKEAFFSGTGLETRDFLYIDDAAALIEKVCKSDIQFAIMNGGSGESVSIKTALETMNDLMQSNKSIVFDDITRQGDPLHYEADVSNALDFGWKPNYSLSQGLKKYVEWCQKETGF